MFVYRHWIDRYSHMTHLEVWYAKIRAQGLVKLLDHPGPKTTQRALDKALLRDHLRALAKLTEAVDGRCRIVPDPPFVVRVDLDEAVARQLPAMIEEYRSTLAADRRALFDRYRLVDMARKVVGVGSVGTRCWILLFQGPNGGPLFLQAKEAGIAGPEAAGLPGRSTHHGERVVNGQRELQTASDVLLGWTTAPQTGTNYYLRQLWDAKGSVDVDTMTPAMLASYAGACGWALARAHARTGDSAAIAGYLGKTPRFDEAMAVRPRVRRPERSSPRGPPHGSRQRPGARVAGRVSSAGRSWQRLPRSWVWLLRWQVATRVVSPPRSRRCSHR